MLSSVFLHLVGQGVVGGRLLVGRGRGGGGHRLRVGRQYDPQDDGQGAAQYHRRGGGGGGGSRIRDTFTIVGPAGLMLNGGHGVGREVDKLCVENSVSTG